MLEELLQKCRRGAGNSQGILQYPKVRNSVHLTPRCVAVRECVIKESEDGEAMLRGDCQELRLLVKRQSSLCPSRREREIITLASLSFPSPVGILMG